MIETSIAVIFYLIAFAVASRKWLLLKEAAFGIMLHASTMTIALLLVILIMLPLGFAAKQLCKGDFGCGIGSGILLLMGALPAAIIASLVIYGKVSSGKQGARWDYAKAFNFAAPATLVALIVLNNVR